MPWCETRVMDSRLKFVAACLQGDLPISHVCEQFGISRKTGYKWLARYAGHGALGLLERSRARQTQSLRIDAATASRLLALRARHPSWGPRKLVARLRVDAPEVTWPAASTVGDLLHRHGLTQARRRRRPGGLPDKPVLVAPTAANVSWAADFKGWFRTGDGTRCEPLTVTDGYSRYILCCESVPRVSFGMVQPILIRVFESYGLPQALRTDNGNPFARRDALGGLTQLSVWLLKLDIWPDVILPGRPDMNGRHERMHRVLRAEATLPPAADLTAQQARLEAWRVEYNTLRPHEALGQRCPASLYTPSVRRYPARLAGWDYPADHHVRKVVGDGYIPWRDGTVYLSAALRGEQVGVAQRDDGDWVVRFRGFDLAVISDETGLLRAGRLCRTRPAGAAASVPSE